MTAQAELQPLNPAVGLFPATPWSAAPAIARASLNGAAARPTYALLNR